MNRCKLFIVALLAVVFFCSCQSTRVYVKTQEQLFEDDSLVVKHTTVSRIDYGDESPESFQKQTVVEDVTKQYYDLSDDYTIISNTNLKTVMHLFTAETEKTSKSEYTTLTFSLVEVEITKATNATNLNVLGKKQMRLKDGVVPLSYENYENTGEYLSSGSYVKGTRFSDDDERLFKTASESLLATLRAKKGAEKRQENKDEPEIDDTKTQRSETYTEKIKVTSVPNPSYIAYSIIGKPFVLLGTSTWNILKCVGYAFINFSGGYNLASGNAKGEGAIWKMPSYKKSKQKAAEAKEANRIKHYPEYHLPFTNNHITVDKYDRNIDVEALLSEDAEKIAVVEHYEYDNSKSVSLSAKADAASTSAMAGLVGTVVTIPVSAVTWVGGAVFGAYGKMHK